MAPLTSRCSATSRLFPGQLLFESGDDRLVVEDCAGQDDLLAQLAGADHFGEIVPGDGVGQAGGDHSRATPSCCAEGTACPMKAAQRVPRSMV